MCATALGRLLAYLDTKDDLAAVAAGKPYDLGRTQVLAGNSPAYRYRGRRFARFGAYDRVERQAREAPRGVWDTCGGDFHSER